MSLGLPWEEETEMQEEAEKGEDWVHFKEKEEYVPVLVI